MHIIYTRQMYNMHQTNKSTEKCMLSVGTHSWNNMLINRALMQSQIAFRDLETTVYTHSVTVSGSVHLQRWFVVADKQNWDNALWSCS